MIKFELAVGQVWKSPSFTREILCVGNKDVFYRLDGCRSENCFSKDQHLENNVLVKHQNGADINEEKYEYQVGRREDEEDLQVWGYTNEWMPATSYPSPEKLYRRLKKVSTVGDTVTGTVTLDDGRTIDFKGTVTSDG